MKHSIEHEIDLARSADVNHVENYPFLLTPASQSQHGVLLVHGFSSTPREMLALGEHLAEQGFTVCGIRLPGHGTSPEDLAQRRAEEWLAAIERGYQILQHMDLTISAAGLSTGALLLLKLSLRRHFESLVLLSPYLRLKHPLAPLVGILKHFITFQHRTIKAENQPFYYQRRPLKAVAEINRLRWQVKKILPQINTPSLVLAAEGDQVISAGTAERIFNQLGSTTKMFHRYGADVPHVLTTAENPCQADVFHRTAEFLMKHNHISQDSLPEQRKKL